MTPPIFIELNGHLIDIGKIAHVTIGPGSAILRFTGGAADLKLKLPEWEMLREAIGELVRQYRPASGVPHLLHAYSAESLTGRVA